jgi:hypothetical protein
MENESLRGASAPATIWLGRAECQFFKHLIGRIFKTNYPIEMKFGKAIINQV